MRKPPDEEKSVRCSQSGCSCSSFRPGGVQLRSCDRCGHGWVAHALQELQAPPPSSSSQVEVALPGLVLDLSSLVLYGTQAVPVRLKILLDRLYSVLTPEQVGLILETVGWTLGDYVRGYVLQTGGRVLDRWSSVTWEEEPLVLEQFLRFGETRPIVELMALSDPELRPRPRRGVNRPSREGSGPEEPHPAEGAARRPDNRPGGLPLLLPFHFSSSAFHRVTPPTKVLGAPSRMRSVLQTPDEDEATDLKIKTDPDRLSRSLWDQSPLVDLDQQESTSFCLAPPPPPPPPSSSLYTPSSSSPSILRPLPSFSSSFLCPVPASPLRPPPPELRSVPLPPPSSSSSSSSSTGGRKGRVCCGVCGKSFYDKGTLKIHYNAVHLKIKHGCTVAGCAMVFSSLRSRNRHSANPNPRLHTPPREAGPRGGACPVATRGLDLQRDDRGLPSQDRAPRPPRTPNCPRPAPPQTWNCPCPAPPQTWNCPRPSTLPSPTPPLFIPAVDKNKRPLHRTAVAMATGNHVRHRAACGGTPKQKRRKSSTPVKIEREALMEEEEEEEEEERGRN